MAEIQLPTWDDAKARIDAGEASALDKLIYEHTPGGSDAEQAFYDLLQAVLKEAVEDALRSNRPPLQKAARQLSKTVRGLVAADHAQGRLVISYHKPGEPPSMFMGWPVVETGPTVG